MRNIVKSILGSVLLLALSGCNGINMERKNISSVHWRVGLLIILTFLNCAQRANYPKNIILFIGDGMGVAHITAAKIVHGTLNLERFKTIGLLTTHSEDQLITDSAAASSALATGQKTYNRAISYSSDNKPLKTVFEYAEELGKSTGLVVTSSVTDATPAAFVTHVDNRYKDSEIAEQIVNSGIDVLLGGGWTYFIPNSNEGSRRADNKNLLIALEKQMKVVLSQDKLPKDEEVKKLAGLLAPVGLPKASERQFSLAELTKSAINILKQNRKGFILMVEGSQIDWAGHEHKQEYIISEIIDFDEAVGVGLDFAEENQETLILVTADHETGGFAIHDGSIDRKEITSTGFTTTEHTASMIPIFAFGPRSKVFSGIQDNTTVGKTIIAYLLKTAK